MSDIIKPHLLNDDNMKAAISYVNGFEIQYFPREKALLFTGLNDEDIKLLLGVIGNVDEAIMPFVHGNDGIGVQSVEMVSKLVEAGISFAGSNYLAPPPHDKDNSPQR